MFPVGDRPKDDGPRLRPAPRAAGGRQAGQPGDLLHPRSRLRRVRRRAARPTPCDRGVIVDERGRVLGGHDGIHRFTVGQRKGLGLASSPTGAPLYVLALSGRGPSGRGRTQGVARANDADGVRRELDSGGAGRPDSRRRADSPSPSGGARHGPRARRRHGARSSSTRRRSPSRPGRPWSSTTETSSSAAAG